MTSMFTQRFHHPPYVKPAYSRQSHCSYTECPADNLSMDTAMDQLQSEKSIFGPAQPHSMSFPSRTVYTTKLPCHFFPSQMTMYSYDPLKTTTKEPLYTYESTAASWSEHQEDRDKMSRTPPEGAMFKRRHSQAYVPHPPVVEVRRFSYSDTRSSYCSPPLLLPPPYVSSSSSFSSSPSSHYGWYPTQCMATVMEVSPHPVDMQSSSQTRRRVSSASTMVARRSSSGSTESSKSSVATCPGHRTDKEDVIPPTTPPSASPLPQCEQDIPSLAQTSIVPMTEDQVIDRDCFSDSTATPSPGKDAGVLERKDSEETVSDDPMAIHKVTFADTLEVVIDEPQQAPCPQSYVIHQEERTGTAHALSLQETSVEPPMPVWVDPIKARDNPTRYAFLKHYLQAHQLPFSSALPLPTACSFYFNDTSTARHKEAVTQYLATVKLMFSCHSVWDFSSQWRQFKQTTKPSQLLPNQNIYCFIEGVEPMWEDKTNQAGGRLTLSPTNVTLDLLFEWALCSFVGGSLARHGVVGIVLSRRTRGDRIELWVDATGTSATMDVLR
ncbi:hypothetical protein BDF14DRAFT_1416814 [Spinellus fusiger]|nr:hypothetical protein BDF14DRAFT_1416814 [Spinellus fusiger]